MNHPKQDPQESGMTILHKHLFSIEKIQTGSKEMIVAKATKVDHQSVVATPNPTELTEQNPDHARGHGHDLDLEAIQGAKVA